MSLPTYLPDPDRQVPAVEVPAMSDLGAPEPSRWLGPAIVLRPFATWLAIVALAARGHLLLALAALPLLFSWALCAVHCAVHSSLGLSPRWNRVVLTLSGMLLFESGHAMEVTHLHHHRADPAAEDPESYIETLSWAHLVGEAPRYRYRLWSWAARQGLPHPGPAVLEAGWNVVSLVVAVLVLRSAPWLSMLIISIHLGNALFVVAAARGPHTNYGRSLDSPLVKVRGRVLPWFLAGHAWHVEHHLYPQVPLPGLRRMLPVLDPILEQLGAQEVRIP